MQQRTLYVGMPGTGKTYTLLNIVSKCLEQGVSPKRIAFVSFSKRAVSEAIIRAQQTINVHRKELPFFKTLHAIAFNSLQLSRDDVLGDEHLEDLSKRIGIDLLDNDMLNCPLSLYHLARAKEMSLSQVRKLIHNISSLPLAKIEYVVNAYNQYKKDLFLVDYTDMIIEYNQSLEPLPIDVAIIDEAQDLSTIQWKMIEIAFSNAKKIFFAGDDDQAIYGWAGADLKSFLNIQKTLTSNIRVLDQSYRVPKKIAVFANHISQKITERFSKRNKILKPTKIEGHGQRNVAFDDIKDKIRSEPFLILVRNRSDIALFKDHLIKEAIPFAIDHKPYCYDKHFLALKGYRDLQNGQKITGSVANLLLDVCGDKTTPKYRLEDELVLGHLHAFLPSKLPDDVSEIFNGIHPKRASFYGRINDLKALRKPAVNVTTIHASKGAECENVFLCGHQSSITHRTEWKYPDDEHRIFYTAATRTKKALYLFKPFGRYNYCYP